ncbi:MerR family transcriptional regulator [Arenimonas terrae]|jgi:MerR family copper efflux transcriptional regulator|uniref:MerR family transcriptional regulator n=1 Tax=Arenimonas terrae TaxID=2546226 RepID=A0A5C4RTI5_9GAMM|nr:MerR family transcriptional regulator [Arenimonas terrae]TNJ34275.1 MerR family transcriptional regulator [Arenimonas terrae]
MNIGEVSRLTGLSARSIRLYEASGIIRRAPRGRSGYRRFGPEDLRTLYFVRNARQLRFELKEIRDLVGLWRGGSDGAGKVEALLAARLRKLRRQESELRASRERLERIQEHSARQPAPGCDIVAILAGDVEAA